MWPPERTHLDRTFWAVSRDAASAFVLVRNTLPFACVERTRWCRTVRPHAGLRASRKPHVTSQPRARSMGSGGVTASAGKHHSRRSQPSQLSCCVMGNRRLPNSSCTPCAHQASPRRSERRPSPCCQGACPTCSVADVLAQAVGRPGVVGFRISANVNPRSESQDFHVPGDDGRCPCRAICAGHSNAGQMAVSAHPVRCRTVRPHLGPMILVSLRPVAVDRRSTVSARRQGEQRRLVRFAGGLAAHSGYLSRGWLPHRLHRRRWYEACIGSPCQEHCDTVEPTSHLQHLSTPASRGVECPRRRVSRRRQGSRPGDGR